MRVVLGCPGPGPAVSFTSSRSTRAEGDAFVDSPKFLSEPVLPAAQAVRDDVTRGAEGCPMGTRRLDQPLGGAPGGMEASGPLYDELLLRYG